MTAPLHTFENHIQWTSVKEVTNRLKQAGFEAYLAGGCVRDLLMNREPNDFDVATSATPDQIEALFPKSIAVGKAFGVIILPFPGFQLEVATFREDLEYKDGRRPEGVKFSTPQADARRRDFTINALFYDLDKKNVIDYVGGEADIQKRLIQTVGEPDLRFDEDKLRILRAVRFSGQLDFEVEEKTLAVIQSRAHEVASVSRERVRDEIQKLLKSSTRAKGLKLLVSTGLLAVLFPDLANHVNANPSRWFLSFAEQSQLGPLDPEVSMALFLLPLLQADSAPTKEVKSRLQNALKLENRFLDAVLFAVQNLSKLFEFSIQRKGELLLLLAKSPKLLELAQVVARSHEIPLNLQALEDLKKGSFDEQGVIPAPFISGADLLSLGQKPGPLIGEMVNESYLLQLEGRLKNRQAALDWCRDNLKI